MFVDKALYATTLIYIMTLLNVFAKARVKTYFQHKHIIIKSLNNKLLFNIV